MIQNKVYIKKDTHEYFDHDGNKFESVSRVLNLIEEPFDAETISKRCVGSAKYAGMTQDQIKKSWEENRDSAANHGTAVHDAIENYTKNFTIEPSNDHLEPMLKSIAADYVPYTKAYSECILYSPSFEKRGVRIAGTTDRILVVNSRGGYVDMEDYKTNISKGIVYHNNYNKYKKHPVSHLTDCNYIRYCLQLSIYGFMYEELTLNKIRSMWLRYIPKDNPLGHYRIPVPYMKNDAIAVLEHFASQKDKKVQKNDDSSEILIFD